MSEQQTEVDQGLTEPVASLGRQATLVYPSAPKEFVTNAPTSISQLYAELMTALASTPDVQIFMQQEDYRRPTGPDNALYIEICPDSVSASTVNKVIKAHVPDPTFGMTDDQKALYLVAQKVHDGESLTPDEQATWNRYLASQVLGPQ